VWNKKTPAVFNIYNPGFNPGIKNRNEERFIHNNRIEAKVKHEPLLIDSFKTNKKIMGKMVNLYLPYLFLFPIIINKLNNIRI